MSALLWKTDFNSAILETHQTLIKSDIKSILEKQLKLEKILSKLSGPRKAKWIVMFLSYLTPKIKMVYSLMWQHN